MIGNDIVDLKQASIDSDWERPRWLEKVFSKKEQKLVLRSQDSEMMVWRLWSMKESAYKCAVQHQGTFRFNPKKMECLLIDGRNGTVIYKDLQYASITNITDRIVYSICNLGSSANVSLSSGIKLLDSKNAMEASGMLKTYFLNWISKKLGHPISFFEIKKNELGVPELFCNKQKLNLAISLTHHGGYGAYAILE